MRGDGPVGSPSVIGLLVLCCIGFGGISGGVALAGGGASVTVVTTGASRVRGALILGGVTFATVFVATLVIRWRVNR